MQERRWPSMSKTQGGQALQPTRPPQPHSGPQVWAAGLREAQLGLHDLQQHRAEARTAARGPASPGGGCAEVHPLGQGLHARALQGTQAKWAGGGGPHECRTFPCILQISQSSPQQGLGGQGGQHLEVGTRWDLLAPGLSFFFPFALKRCRESFQAVKTSHCQQLTPSRLERGPHSSTQVHTPEDQHSRPSPRTPAGRTGEQQVS